VLLLPRRLKSSRLHRLAQLSPALGAALGLVRRCSACVDGAQRPGKSRQARAVLRVERCKQCMLGLPDRPVGRFLVQPPAGALAFGCGFDLRMSHLLQSCAAQSNDVKAVETGFGVWKVLGCRLWKEPLMSMLTWLIAVDWPARAERSRWRISAASPCRDPARRTASAVGLWVGCAATPQAGQEWLAAPNRTWTRSVQTVARKWLHLPSERQ
jgi:hypothetical protein